MNKKILLFLILFLSLTINTSGTLALISSGSCTGSACYVLAAINGQCGTADGQSFTSAPTTNLCSSGTLYSVMGSGPWYWICLGSGGGLSDTCSATKVVAADTTPPTVSITSPTAGRTISNTFVFTAKASDNVKVVGVQFMVDGVNVGAEDTLSPYQLSFNTKTLSNGTHTVSAKARDAAGNTKTSAAVSVIIKNAVPDTTPPTVSITSPTADKTISGTVSLIASASDNVKVVGVQFMVDGVSVGAEDTLSPYQLSFNTKTLSNGTHTISAKARDAAGNTKTSTPISVTVNNVVPDTTLPVISITNPVAGSVVSDTINLTANATDNIGVVGVQFLIDNVNFGAEDTLSPYQINFDTKTLNNGTHTVSAKARDAAGNTKTSAAVSITINNIIPDTTPPIVSVTSPIAGSVVSDTINLTANATDNIGVVGVQFVLDGMNFNSEDTVSPYQTSLDTKTLSDGGHTISAKARDAAGNITTSAAISFTINNVVPPQPEENLIQNPSLEDSNANNPIGWQTGNWGTNTAIFTYPVAGYNSSSAAKVQLTQYTDGDAKWYFNDVPVLPNQGYKFSDTYQSNVQSNLTARFTLSDNTYQYVDIGNLESSISWTGVEKNFTTPVNAVSVTIFHLINSVGYLVVDNFSITKTNISGQLDQGMISINFDDGWLSTYNNALPILNTAGLKSTNYIITGTFEETDDYINESQVLAIQSAGHEVGAHSKTHPDLTKLSSVQLQDEVSGSKQDLLAIGVNQVPTFSYPYGEANSTVITATKNAGYIGARGVEAGFNTKETDPYLLLSQSVEVNTTIDTIKTWIDSAIQNKTWVILVFHKVDYSNDQYSTTPEIFQQITNYLIAKNALVVTNAAGLQALSQ
jgi:peptidoglycan/xylan/chitin deacetylase (PgdA/CDA1 family)